MLRAYFEGASRAAERYRGSTAAAMLWLSTDHFLTAPKLNVGDVGHIGLLEFLDSFWTQVYHSLAILLFIPHPNPWLQPAIANNSFAWGICVHPYDAGDPRENLLSRGIYTFATLNISVRAFQCSKVSHCVRVSQRPTTVFAHIRGVLVHTLVCSC